MDDLWLWTQAWLEGDLSDADARKLNERLSTDPQALAWFVETCRVDEQLRHVAAGDGAAREIHRLLAASPGAALSAHVGSAVEARKSRGWMRRILDYPRPVSWTVATLFMISLVTALAWFSVPAYRRWAAAPAVPQPVATLIDTRQAIWGSERIPPARGARLLTGQQLDLQSGAIEISYDSGANVVVVGPATLTLNAPSPLADGAHSPGGAALQRGRMLVHAPQAARGFTILTPDTEIVDLGTRFGVEVVPAPTQVSTSSKGPSPLVRAPRAAAASRSRLRRARRTALSKISVRRRFRTIWRFSIASR